MKQKSAEQVGPCFFPLPRQKKGQFYILAAVLLASVIFSLSISSTNVQSNSEPERFFELTDEIKMEADYVLNQDLYNSKDNFTEFLKLLSINLAEYDPYISAVFIYNDGINFLFLNHNSKNLTIYNSSEEIVTIEGYEIVGEYTVPPVLSINEVNAVIKDSQYTNTNYLKLEWLGEEINYTVSLKEYKSFYILFRKEKGDDIYVEIK